MKPVIKVSGVDSSYTPKAETLEKLAHTLIPPYDPRSEIKDDHRIGVNNTIQTKITRKFRLTPAPKQALVEGLQCILCKNTVDATLAQYGKAVTSFAKQLIDRIVRRDFKIVEEREYVVYPVFTTGYICNTCFNVIRTETYNKDGEDRPCYLPLPWPVEGKPRINTDNMKSDSKAEVKSVHQITLYKGREFKLRLNPSIKNAAFNTEDLTVDPKSYRKFGHK